jgi:hypothetical protein
MITEHPEIRTYLLSRAMGHSSSTMVEKRYGVLAEGKMLEVFRGAEEEPKLSEQDLKQQIEALQAQLADLESKKS